MRVEAAGHFTWLSSVLRRKDIGDLKAAGVKRQGRLS